MDNLSSHKRASVRDLIEAAGARLMLLPGYTLRSHSNDAAHRRNLGLPRPDLNSGLWSLIGKLVDLFQPQECANDVRFCGYAPN